MGTWSTELLGNDSALDTLGEVARGEFSFADLAEELGADYIDNDAGVAVLTLIEVALAVRGQRELPQDDEGNLTVDIVGALVDDERARWLLAQVDRVLRPGSEVYDLWREAGDETLHEWLSNANAAIGDLRRGLGPSSSTITSRSADDR
ncbi:DUF4259 domain-containing protein [Promicromonospora soli]